MAPKAPYLADRKPALSGMSPEALQAVRELSDEYIAFLTQRRSERDRVNWAIELLRQNGFSEYRLGETEPLKPGARFYYLNSGLNLAAGIVGLPAKGSKLDYAPFSIIGAHCDCPRISMKPNPVVQHNQQGMVTFRTRCYGGIKNNQFTSIPMEMRIYGHTLSGKTVDLNIGSKPSDPVFTIPDCPVHLMASQAERKGRDLVKGEEMGALVWTTREPKDAVEGESNHGEKELSLSHSLFKFLYEEYGICEEDFPGLEIDLYPHIPARYVGFDRSMVGGPGQDDGVCCFGAIKALIASAASLGSGSAPCGTSPMACLFAHEEIGSCGNIGAQSHFWKDVCIDVLERTEVAGSQAPRTLPQGLVARMLQDSLLISADVTGLSDPNHSGDHAEGNAAVAGFGVALERYSNGRDSRTGNYSDAEISAAVIRALHGTIPYQFAELGKIGMGGGGTLCQYVTRVLNCKGIEVGIGLLAMHSPFEISHIGDIWSLVQAYIRLVKPL